MTEDESPSGCWVVAKAALVSPSLDKDPLTNPCVLGSILAYTTGMRGGVMAVADYVTKEDLEEALKTLVTKADLAELVTKADLKADLAALKAEVIEAIQHGPSANF